LLDLQLPHVQGNRVAQHLRVEGEHRHRVIIGITGDEALYGSAHEAFHHRLAKPIDPTRLLALIDAEWVDHFRGTPYEH
jgi:CheY-like chemotaxis protein